MYIYANVGGETQVVESFMETEELLDAELWADSHLVDAIDETWIQRKKWDAATQSFVDLAASESIYHKSLEFPHIDSDGVKHWLDVFINDLAEDVSNLDASNFAAADHTHSGYADSSHTHTASALVSMADALFATNYNGGVKYSYGSGSGKNVLTEISNMTAGLHTIYSIAGTDGNPKSDESWRMLVHKTSVTIGWVLAFDAAGSIYSNYQSAAGTFKGWRCIYDAEPPILWMGEYWCTETQTVTPSKKLSECRNGWVLVWSDYDVDNEVSSNGDCYTTVIPRYNASHVNWSGQSYIATIPSYLNDSGALTWVGKRLYVHDAKITGHAVNHVTAARDVCLRAIYEY